MHLSWLESAMLGVIGLWFGMATSEPDNNHNVIQPVGPKMCDHLCSRRIRCSGYLYTPLHLSCRLIIEKTRPDQQSLEGTYYRKVSKVYQAEGNLTCLRNSKIFYTRRNIPKCRRRQLTPSQPMKFTRILMLPHSRKSEQGRQLYLRNKTLSPYPYIRTGHSEAVAYISSTRKLVISDRDGLVLITLDGTDRTVITTVKHCFGITVDEEHQLVFLASRRGKTIHVMTTEGKDWKLITTIPRKSGQLAADSQRQVIYVVITGQYIARYTYKGQLEGIVAKGNILRQLYFNSETNVLYYMVAGWKYVIFKMFLSDGTKFTIPLQVPSNVFYVYANTIYVLRCQGKGNLLVLSDSGKYITTIKTGFYTDCYTLDFCVIP